MKKTFQFICALLLFTGCQEGDGETIPNNSQNQDADIPSKVTVISEDQEAIYQIDVQTDKESLTEYNLTQTIGALPSYRSKYINGTQVSYVYKEAQEVKAVFKDVANQNSQSYDLTSKLDDPYQGVNYGNAIEDYLLVFNRSGPKYEDLSVFATNVNNGSSRKITFGKGTSYSSTILYEGGWLVLKFNDLSGNDVLASINLESGEVNTKVFNGSYFAFLAGGQIHMVSCNSKYEIYDVLDLSLMDSGSLDVCNYLLDWTWRSGLNKTQVDGNDLLVHMQPLQPSPDLTSPGVYDLTTGEMIEDKMILTSIRLELYKLYPQTYIKMNTYTVDLARKHIVIGYEKDDGNGVLSGGLIFTDFSGEILKEIILNRPPQEIIITKS